MARDRNPVNDGWEIHSIRREATGLGVAVAYVKRPSGSMVKVALMPSDLRKIVIQAAEAMEPDG